MKEYLIKYSGWFSFLIWILPGQSKEKKVLCHFDDKGVEFKSDKYEGKGILIKNNYAYILRYSLTALFLFFVFPEVLSNSKLFMFSFFIGLFIPFLFIKIPFFKKNQYLPSLFFSLLILAVLALESFLFDYRFAAKSLIFSFQYGFFFWMVLKILIDVFENKGKKLYCLCERKILFYV